MSPRQAANRLGKIAADVETSALSELGRQQQRILRASLAQTSGTHSAAELQALARKRGAGVYSRRRPDARFNPNIANVQKGNLLRGWNAGAVYVDSAGDAHAPVTNTSPEAKWFDGKPHGHTVARDVAGAVVTKTESSVVQRIIEAVRRILG